MLFPISIKKIVKICMKGYFATNVITLPHIKYDWVCTVTKSSAMNKGCTKSDFSFLYKDNLWKYVLKSFEYEIFRRLFQLYMCKLYQNIFLSELFIRIIIKQNNGFLNKMKINIKEILLYIKVLILSFFPM